MDRQDSTTRFTLDMPPELRTRLKMAAARKGVTMRQYSLEALSRQLDRDDLQALTSGGFSREAVGKAEALQRSIFGRRRLADDSVELIREARKERADEL